MYKMDKTVGKATTHKENEKAKLFATATPLSQRLSEAWYLTCMAYGIDYKNPPRMNKAVFSMRKHEK